MTLSRSIAEHLEKSNATLDDLEAVLSKYQLQSLLPQILQHLLRKQKMREQKNIVEIESPFTLSEESIQTIKKIVNAEDKEHTVKINQELLAGFKAKHRDTMYDGSAKRIIDQFAKR